MTQCSTEAISQDDLTSCDREPIHLIGSVQPFGCLLVLDDDWRVTYLSANCPDFLGRSVEATLGTHLRDLVGSDTLHDIRSALQTAMITQRAERLLQMPCATLDRVLHFSVHHNGSYTLLEIETCEPSSVRPDDLVRTMLHQFSGHHSFASLTQTVASSFKHYSGFDRVMVYRFAHDDSGQVIAEAKEETMESYLGLNYPASDIPKQARALYQKNLFRILSDVNGSTIPIVCAPDQHEPATGSGEIDLSMTQLRAVSPVHIEYLQNMGVGASLSLSIVVEGRLWGLIACHHRGPKTIDFILRSQLEVFAEMFSLELSRQLLEERTKHLEAANHTYQQIILNLNTRMPVLQALAQNFEMMRRLIDCDGIACLIDEQYLAEGNCPDEHLAKLLAARLSAQPHQPVYSVSKLSDLLNEFEHEDLPAGVLAIQVSKHPKDYLLFFRNSVTQVKRWAGNPHKAVTGHADERLSPRKSFAAWEEAHYGQCEVWTEQEIQHASSMRVGILELTIRSLEEKAATRRKHQQKQELLISELNHRVRNILNLVSAILSQTNDHNRDVDEFISVLSARIMALSSAHDQLTQSEWTEVLLSSLLQTEFKAYANSASSISLNGPQVKLRAYAITPVVLVIHELLTNAAKYGSLSATSSQGKVNVRWYCDDKFLHIDWEELGGPPVTQVKSEGFGMTIIRSVIPHELKGETEIAFNTSGLNVHIQLPLKYVIKMEDQDQSDAAVDHALQSNDAQPPVLSKGLIVEDSLLIAIDMQKKLKALGFKDVQIAGTSTQAIRHASENKPDLAILDVHLGNETSLEAARALRREGIPLLFATGYGTELALPADLRSVPILTKPIDETVLKERISALGAMGAQ